MDDRVSLLRSGTESAAGTMRLSAASLATFGAYISIVASSTTHEQLLLNTPVVLPIINANVSIVAFFIVAPALFAILHLQTLWSVNSFWRRNALLQAEIDRLPLESERQLQRALGGFSIRFISRGPRTALIRDALSTTFILLVALALPIVVLVGMQAAFLPYHSVGITWFHRTLILIDVIVSVLLWLSANPTRRTLTLVSSALLLFPILFLSFVVMTIPREKLEDWVIAAMPEALVTKYDRKQSYFDDLPLNIPARRAFWLTAIWFESPISPLGLTRNINMNNATLVMSAPSLADEKTFGIEEAWTRMGRGLSLDGRDLRYASFRNADLRGVSVRGASLEGADLSGANLSFMRGEAVASSAMLCVAYFDSTNQQCRASFLGANLSRAKMFRAQLPGAHMVVANLDGANLVEANLAEAYLSLATMRGAWLVDADLTLAVADGAFAEGAHFMGTRLVRLMGRGMDLRDSDLYQANLQFARLMGADLTSARLDFANFNDADLQGTLFASAAFLTTASNANLRGADLSGISFYPPTTEDWASYTQEAPTEAQDSLRAMFKNFDGAKTSSPNSFLKSPSSTEGIVLNKGDFANNDGTLSTSVESSTLDEHAKVMSDVLLEYARCDLSAGIGIARRVRRERLSGRMFDPVTDNYETPRYAAAVEEKLFDSKRCPKTKPGGGSLGDFIRKHAGTQ